MKKMQFLPWFLLAILCLTRCELLSFKAEYRLVCPAWPAHWQQAFSNLKGWLLIAEPDDSESCQEVTGQQSVLSALVPKKAGSLVLYYPAVKEGIPLLRPWGAVFPTDFEPATKTAELTTAGGYVAERLLNLYRKGICCPAFNTARLIRLLEKRGHDPYWYDPSKVELDIAEACFNTFSLKQLPRRNLALQLEAGSWFIESHFSPLVFSTGDYKVSFPDITLGLHTLMRAEDGMSYFLNVLEREEIIFAF